MRARTLILAASLVVVSLPALAQFKPRNPNPPKINPGALHGVQRLEALTNALSKPQPIGTDEKLKRLAAALKIAVPPSSALEQPFKVTPRAPVAGTAKTYFMYTSVYPFAIASPPIPDGAAWLDAASSPGAEILVTFSAAANRNYLVDCEMSDAPVKVTLSSGTSFTIPATGGHLVFGVPKQASAGLTNFLLEPAGATLQYYSCEITPVK